MQGYENNYGFTLQKLKFALQKLKPTNFLIFSERDFVQRCFCYFVETQIKVTKVFNDATYIIINRYRRILINFNGRILYG